MKRRKKRSLRGKLLMTLVFLTMGCLAIIILKHTIDVFNIISNKDNKKEAVFLDINDSPENINAERGNNVTEINDNGVITRITEKELVTQLMVLVGKIPYEKAGKCNIVNDVITVEALDSFGLVDYAYANVFGKHLAEVGINEDNLINCEEVSSNNLKIGDVAIYQAGESYIYGIYIGCYGSYPIFVYTWDIPLLMGDIGFVSLSYDKNDCNDLFGGMYPISYNKYVRLPGFNFSAGIDYNLDEFISAENILLETENNYAAAAYRIGEWLKNKDINNLASRLKTDVLNENRLILNEKKFENYINNFTEIVGVEDFFFRLVNYQVFDGYATIVTEIINIDNTASGYTQTDNYYELTVFDDGKYLPGSVFSLPKNYMIYGFQWAKDDNVPADPEGDSVVYIVPDPDDSITSNEENYIIREDGFSIDLRQFNK